MKRIIVACLFALVLVSPVRAGWLQSFQVSIHDSEQFFESRNATFDTLFNVVDATSAKFPHNGFYVGAILCYDNITVAPEFALLTAAWNNTNTIHSPIPLYVYSYTYSASPPALTQAPVGNYIERLNITPGTYTLGQYMISLPAPDINGHLCVILETLASTQNGSPFMGFSTDPPSTAIVPEPSFVAFIPGILLYIYLMGSRRHAEH